jgi:hypothetical protein
MNLQANHSDGDAGMPPLGKNEYLEQLLGYEPSIFSRDKLAYIQLNIPAACPSTGSGP